ncbi:hypothetical protein [Massilia sp. BJB1822]|uniref:hypothetical protein n=1 Tax=Massilia sp. BJB1822 TaxID=2744470 RepID=UPI00159346EE|nr:hypothetical protein [Massilia sp. BJB1822]NVD97214.1 hypothetical protein [Massilia sp. BJB1822]
MILKQNQRLFHLGSGIVLYYVLPLYFSTAGNAMRKPAQLTNTANQEKHGAALASVQAKSAAIPPLVLPSNFDTQHHLKIAATGKAQPLTPADFAKRIASLRAKKVG